MPSLLSENLNRDSFVYAGTAYENYQFSTFWQIRRAGFVNGLNVPLTLAAGFG